MKDKLEVRILPDEAYERWNRLVWSAPAGSIYSTTPYLDTLCRATGGAFKVFGVFSDAELWGGVALYESSRYFHNVVSNRLLLYYNGFIVAQHQSKYPSHITSRSLAVLTSLAEALANSAYADMAFHNRSALNDLRPFLCEGWTVTPSYTLTVDVSDLTQTWEKIDKNLRRLIHRAMDAGVEFTDKISFDEFFELHENTALRKGAPRYLPKAQFQLYVDELRNNGLAKLYGARLSCGTIAATQLVLLGNHPVSHTVCAAAEERSLSLGVTPFLRWKAFEDLAKHGYQSNDLTDAALNSVTSFKSALGGRLEMTTVVSKRNSSSYALIERGAMLIRRGDRIARSLVKLAKLKET